MTTLRSGQLAAAAGVNPQTLRYYERIGLLTAAERTPGGHRLYSPAAVTALRVIKAAQRLGFSLDDIADLLDLGAHRHGRRQPGRPHREPGLPDRAAAKLAEVEAKIEDLVVIRDTLERALDVGCDDLLACAERPGCPLPFTDSPALPSQR
ncbi:MerR family transcriptional regulator [Saccharothrix variisporea]|uniref:MerR family mercuric resistance operon transcriptional regulator n=1 Tax=Saccharothrix variisporea TaxID=543527 RepID=A0A495X6G1_9PSEU|nr:MerR family transcriptional regulator [Saccharothrix variisporea]RKT69119.1 MerR family mercuric resistance operon transcriptional regulator [Saccharothrix variisporea]